MSSYVLYNYLLSGTLFWQPAGCCQTWPAACRYIRSCGAFHLLHRIFSYQIAYFRPYFLKKSLHHGTLELPRHDDKFEYKRLRSMQSMGEAFYIHCRMAHNQRENYLFENEKSPKARDFLHQMLHTCCMRWTALGVSVLLCTYNPHIALTKGVTL